MRTYKYQIREHPENKRLGNMLDDLADVHNHFLALEKRYYRIYGKYAGRYRMQPHLTKLLERTHKHWAWIPRDTLDQVIIRIHIGYERFFAWLRNGRRGRRVSPPKFKKRSKYRSAKFQTGYKIYEESEDGTPSARFACPSKNGVLRNKSLFSNAAISCITTTAIGRGTSDISKSCATLSERFGSMSSQITPEKKSCPLRVKV